MSANKIANTQSRALRTISIVLLSVLAFTGVAFILGATSFKLDKDVVCGIAARKNGCSFYPFSGSVLAALRTDLVKYKQTKSALHFETPLPKTLVRKLMTQRMVQIMVKKKRK